MAKRRITGRVTGADRKSRLLAAAIVAFARDGFEGASVRTICSAAGVNVAAVRYYFEDKAGLYFAAIAAAAESLMSDRPPPLRREDESPETALRAFVRWGVEFTVAGGSRRAALTKIILRELREPTLALDRLFAERGAPLFGELRAIVTTLAQSHGARVDAGRLAVCILASTTQYEHSCELLTRAGFPPPRTSAQFDTLADLIAGMAIAFIRSRSEDSHARGGKRKRAVRRSMERAA